MSCKLYSVISVLILWSSDCGAWTSSISITWDYSQKYKFSDPKPEVLDQKLGRWRPAICVSEMILELTKV